MAQEYIPQKRKRGRPRTRKYQGDEIIKFGGKPPVDIPNDEMELLKKEVAELKTQLASMIKVDEKQVEKVVPIDTKKIEEGNILNINQRDRIETKIAQLEHQLDHAETPIGSASGKHGGVAECFMKNDVMDKRVIYDRLMHARYSLQVGTHGKLSDSDKNKLFQDKKDIEKELMETSPSLSKQNSSNESVVNETAAYLTKHKEVYEKMRVKLKNINKILDPENPEAGSLTYLYQE